MYMTPIDTSTMATADATSGAGLLDAADLGEGTVFSPSIHCAATNIDSGSPYDKTFVENIRSLLDVPHYSSIISWNDTGTAVIVHDVEAFISKIMPVHFKHSQFGSFTRRMRRWGFRVSKKLSSQSSSLSVRKGNVMEFSSKNFLRDQPELSLLMKDERQAKKKFKSLGPNDVKKADGMENIQMTSLGVCVHHHPPSSSSSTRGGDANPSSESQLSMPENNSPSYSTKMSAEHDVLEPQQQQQLSEISTMMKSTGDEGLNMANIHDGLLYNYPQESTFPSTMITPHKHSNQDVAPMMNNMTMPPHLPPLQPPFQYPPSGYGDSSEGHDIGQALPTFRYPAPFGYPPYQQQQPQQQSQQPLLFNYPPLQFQPQQQQQLLQQQSLFNYPPLPPAAVSFFRNVDARASTANVTLVSSLSRSSSEESPPEKEPLPTKPDP